MKLPILLFGLTMIFGVAYADDVAVVQKVAERKTCADIKTEIAMLAAIENPDEVTVENLRQLQTQQRSNCMPKSAGRRTIMRNVPSGAQKNTDAITAKSDALSEYLANKKSNCDKLNTEIEKLATNADDAESDILASMRGVYDMDCTDKPAAISAAAAEQTYEEWAAEFDANLAAGLCGDGTKPNRYGCCTGETFKDMGNAEFACCPKSGGLCFPPIK